MNFIDEHLRIFQHSSIGGWSGRAPARWFQSVGYVQTTLQRYALDRPLVRQELFQLAADPNVDTLDLCMTIFAWGGMTVRNGKAVVQMHDWVDTAHALRTGEIDHFAAYQQFFELIAADRMTNCGPAYFTKLLFFLPPADHARGIIMDQWTARSVNLLTGKTVVVLVKTSAKPTGYRVSAANGTKVYREFCEVVAALSSRMNISIAETEMRLFSEGRGKGSWRTYVRAQTDNANGRTIRRNI